MEMRNASPGPSSGPSTTAGRKRGKTPCCSKVGLKRGPWTPEEDEVLASVVRREGEGRWRTLPKRAGLLRCGKSCRLRWMNYLRPSIKHGPIAPDEEDLILRLHRLLGNKWSLIAGRIPGRTDNEIKNYWNSHLSKKLLSQGIDPRTHKPLDPSSPSPLPVHHKLKTPAVPLPNPNPNPNTRANPSANAAHELTPSAPHEVGGSSRGVFLGDDHGNYFSGFDLDHDETWRSFGTVGSVDRCTDDSFSSFLDSLIDEDSAFLDPQQQQRISQMEPADPTMPDLGSSGHPSSLDENVSGQF